MDIKQIRQDFPILETRIGTAPLIYLDNAATTQLPLPVLDCYKNHFLTQNANIHRGAHALSNRSTDAYENARQTVAVFLGAENVNSIIFTPGTTASINMAARLIEPLVQPDDTIAVTNLEHHSDFLPWAELCKRKKATLLTVPHVHGDITPAQWKEALPERTKLAAFAHVTNTTGTLFPVETFAKAAHEKGAFTLVDGAQALRHASLSLANSDIDFYVFSGHKVMAPPGTGVLYISPHILDQLDPVLFGGGMVDTIFTGDGVLSAIWRNAPERFEAGTPNYPGSIALAGSLEYLEQIGRQQIADRETALLTMLEEGLHDLPGVRILGQPQTRAGVLSIHCADAHPYDLARVLDAKGVAVRAGQMCAQPALASFGLDSLLRISPAFYNTEQEIEQFLDILKESVKFLSKFKA